MRIHIAKFEPERIGGGWTFANNFSKVIPQNDYDHADIYFIPSPSMVSREEVLKAKEDGKKIVLRIDNAVRNSRNRNTGMTRMRDFAQWADLVIYQSEWAMNYLMPYLKKEGKIIVNGVDLNLYPKLQKTGNIILYSRFNRDETKNWEAARYWFSRYHLYHPETKLLITGQFSPELIAGNFDFYNGETFEYLGVLNQHNMAKVYGIADKFLYTYFNDACSNSLIEALVSGCEIVGDDYYRHTGGAPEIIYKHYLERGRDYFSLERMAEDYNRAFATLDGRGYEGSYES